MKTPPSRQAARTASPRRIGRLGQRRQVVLPRAICDQLNLQEGDPVEFSVQGGRIVVKPKKLVDADGVLTPEEENLVRQGEIELRQGRYVTWTRAKKRLKL